MAEMYKKDKQGFDQMVYAYLVKRLREPIEDTDAFGTGIVDERGAENPQAASNPNASWAYTDFDKLVFLLKSTLGEQVNTLPKVFDGFDSMLLMRPTQLAENLPVYRKVIGLVEEISYLPPENRGEGKMQPQAEEDGMTMEMRMQRAFTCASFLMSCIINGGTVKSENLMNFDEEVLDITEGTFGIRGLGTYKDIVDYLKAGKVIDYAHVNPEGYLLAVRIAKVLATANNTIFMDKELVGNEFRSWRTLATYEG